jgi:FkbM family methyltransferase
MDRAIVARLRTDPEFVSLRRSLDTYYGNSANDAAMDALYRRFLKAGDLAFDIGSHVGDRIGSFRRLGARVVAVEPQPDCARVIRAIYGDDTDVTVVQFACGAQAGQLTLHVNSANPTVSTASGNFMRAANRSAGWEGQRWDRNLVVPVTTLDALITQFGRPAFAKIDVEGFETDVLRGLSAPLEALSFEFTTIQRGVALACLDSLEELGLFRYDVELAESRTLRFGRWVSPEDMRRFLETVPHETNSGDVFAVHRG